ncbi:MAG: beta-lactamase family protein, partial [Acidobacteriota bacterium]|nr:beta-lactamase family protein [Acidobacteriota bacterium]
MTTVVTASEQRNLADLVGRRVLSGDVSAAVALVGDRHGIRQTACAGRRSATNERAPSPAALFDLASLSKPFAATLALRLASTQALPLSLCLADVWENVARPMARVTLESLLRHRAGLIPWTPL